MPLGVHELVYQLCNIDLQELVSSTTAANKQLADEKEAALAEIIVDEKDLEDKINEKTLEVERKLVAVE